MTPAEVVEILMLVGNRIDLQWGMFITVHLALFGGLIYVDRPLRKMEKFAAMVTYTGFAIVNYIVMKNQVLLMDYLQQDIVSLSQHACCLSNHVIQGLAKQAAQGKTAMSFAILLGTHATMFVLVCLSIIFDQALSHKVSDNEA